ncbi:hypothetical protein L2E82_18461 [Cichorium intybus]|uniref:Uncharacterized protein n=1 Tax=Cichorium intybus TaxID=13427 RepID=A0ACB9FA66_CICIN|nr:hypothetical protein L2E82_18461 [Cichorium intybus]
MQVSIRGGVGSGFGVLGYSFLPQISNSTDQRAQETTRQAIPTPTSRCYQDRNRTGQRYKTLYGRHFRPPSGLTTEVKAYHEALFEALLGENIGFNMKNFAVKDLKGGYVVPNSKEEPAKDAVEVTSQMIMINHPGLLGTELADHLTPHDKDLILQVNTEIAELNENLKTGREVLAEIREKDTSVIDPGQIEAVFVRWVLGIDTGRTRRSDSPTLFHRHGSDLSTRNPTLCVVFGYMASHLLDVMMNCWEIGLDSNILTLYWPDFQDVETPIVKRDGMDRGGICRSHKQRIIIGSESGSDSWI